MYPATFACTSTSWNGLNSPAIVSVLPRLCRSTGATAATGTSAFAAAWLALSPSLVPRPIHTHASNPAASVAPAAHIHRFVVIAISLASSTSGASILGLVVASLSLYSSLSAGQRGSGSRKSFRRRSCNQRIVVYCFGGIYTEGGGRNQTLSQDASDTGTDASRGCAASVSSPVSNRKT